MLKYNNTHIFTGYLKQLLSSFNLPTCKIYTREFARYLETHGTEDPRVLKSFDEYRLESNKSIITTKSVRFSYLKNNEVFNYFGLKNSNTISNCRWYRIPDIFYSAEKSVKGLTKTLVSPGPNYDAVTHKYLGEYLRFIRDYYNVNLMSMYNCFSDEICSNVNLKIDLSDKDKKVKSAEASNEVTTEINISSQDSGYKLYKLPVKLFADYTVAIESTGSIELFCGLYNSVLETNDLGTSLIKKTYQRFTGTLFSQPFLYNRLNVNFWRSQEKSNDGNIVYGELFNECWNITAREQDLCLFIRVPVSCKSSIVVLEGDYREYNSGKYLQPGKYCLDGTIYIPKEGQEKPETTTSTIWQYAQNKTILNFSEESLLAEYAFKPISRLQLLAFNTRESYPFADRLIEYLTGSAITSIDDIHDNIARAQKVMSQNKNFFKIEGLWEEKIQKILYDYMTNSGEIKVATITVGDNKNDSNYYNKEVDPSTYDGPTKQIQVLKDSREGYHRQLGHTSKSMLFDILGYVDKDTEKTYASYTKKVDKSGKLVAQVKNTIQNVDIYNGLYDI